MRDLYEAIGNRYSVRSYQSNFPKELWNELTKSIVEITPYNGQLCRIVPLLGAKQTRSVLQGVIGSYGIISNAPGFAAFIGHSGQDNYRERVGFCGEQFVLAATNLGIGSCWIGGFFKPQVCEQVLPTPLANGEKILAIATLGIPQPNADRSLKHQVLKKLSAKQGRKKGLGDLMHPQELSALPPWAVTALQAVTRAPSAVNRQPYRFALEGNSLAIRILGKNSNYSLIDCGIAMAHWQIAAAYHRINYQWKPIDQGDTIAHFPLTNRSK